MSTREQRRIERKQRNSKSTIQYDGFRNLLKGFGSERDTRVATTYGTTPRISNLYSLLEDLYVTNSMAAKAIDIPIDDAFREGREITSLEDEQLKQFNNTYKKIDKKINYALKIARVYGGSFIAVITKDQDQSKPLTNISKDSIYNITVLDPTQVVPQNLDRNPLSPNYLKPTNYIISNTSVKLHPSRLFYIDGITTTKDERERNNGYGSSLFERIYLNIQDSVGANTSLRNLIEQSNIDVVGMKDLTKSVASGAEVVVQERIEILSKMKSMLNTIAIDADDSYTNIAKNFGTLDKIQIQFIQLVAFAADIPFTRFFGKSAEGMSATGEGDARNYYDKVKADIQIGSMDEIYEWLDPIISSNLFGNSMNIEYEYNPLWQLSAKEQADIMQIKANVHGSYLDRGVIDEVTVLKELQEEGLYVDYKPDKPTIGELQ